MKILVAFGFLLVAGILNACLAQTETPKKPSLKESYAELLGKVKANRFTADDSDETAVESIKAKCNRNGGPTAYDTANKIVEDVDNAFAALLNDTDDGVVSEVSETDSQWNHETICCSIMTVKNLIVKGVNGMKPCLDLDEREGLDIIVNSFVPAVDYVCGNKGSNLLGFFENDGVECLMVSAEGVLACLGDNSTSTESTESIEDTTSAAVIPAPFDIPEFAVDLEDCTNFETVQNCIVGEMNGCLKRTPANFVNSIFNIIKRESGCKAILRAHAAPASNNCKTA